MGYYMDQGGTEFHIKLENFPATLDAIKSLAGQETIQDSSGGHFSWVHTHEFLEAETLEDAFDAWRWAVRFDAPTGDITDIWFEGEKAGDDEYLFQAIAPYVEEGSYINMQGEDGYLWRWYFDGEELITQEGVVIWR